MLTLRHRSEVTRGLSCLVLTVFMYSCCLYISTASQHARFVKKCEINSIKSIFRTLISILQAKRSFAEKRTKETANSQLEGEQPLRTSRYILYIAMHAGLLSEHRPFSNRFVVSCNNYIVR